MTCSSDRLLERTVMTLFFKGKGDKFRKAVATAIISAKYIFNRSRGPSVTVQVAMAALSGDPVVIVSQMAPPIPTIPFFSDEQVATTIPWVSLAI